jgi:ribonuclease HI
VSSEADRPISHQVPNEDSHKSAGNEIGEYLMRCERALLDPAVRRDRTQVETLLAEDFQEFGSSGRVWDRQTIVDSLATEDYAPPTAEQMHCTQITADVALVTYRTVRIDSSTGARKETLRSSLWIKESDKWRVRFHQGTPASNLQSE